MIENVLILEDNYPNDLETYFLKCISAGLIKNGKRVINFIVESSNPDLLKGLNEYNTCIFTINSKCLRLNMKENVFLYLQKYISIDNFLILNFIMDHPVYSWIPETLNIEFPEKCVILANDNNWIRYIKKHYKFRNIDSFYLGGRVCETQIPFKNKIDSVMFLGTLNESRNNFMYNIPNHNRIIHDILNNPDLLIEDVLDKYNVSKNTENVRIVDSYFRYYYRKFIMENLAKKGLPIEIIGNKEWHFLDKYKNVTVHNYIPAVKCPDEINKRKYLVNINPWTKDGPHDRIFDTTLNGTLLFTNRSEYIKNVFTHKESVIFYDLKHPSSITDKVLYYFNHPEEAEVIANKGRELTVGKEEWYNRSCSLIDLIHKWDKILNA